MSGHGGRTLGSGCKDLKYDKFFVIKFRFRDDVFVLCNHENQNKYVPINKVKVDDLPRVGVVKFEEMEQAKETLSKLPEIVINGYDIELEIGENTFDELLIGV